MMMFRWFFRRPNYSQIRGCRINKIFYTVKMEKNSGGVEAARVIYQWGREGGMGFDR
jgi:hypothetical protein